MVGKVVFPDTLRRADPGDSSRFARPIPRADGGTVIGAAIPAPGNPMPGMPSWPLTTPQGVYLPTQKANLTLASGVGQMILAEPDGKRVFLMLRSARSSTGVANFSFGEEASNAERADFELAPGESVLLDYFVSQSRLYAYANGGAVAIVWSWSDYQEPIPA